MKMGCYIDIHGRLELNRKLDDETYELLYKLSKTRRMARSTSELKKMGFDGNYGVQGEFFVDEDKIEGDDTSILDHNCPPATQPDLWCKWVPTEDRLGIEWNGMENFINYKAWLKYISEQILLPRSYTISGEVEVVGPAYFDHNLLSITSKKRTVNIKESRYPDVSEVYNVKIEKSAEELLEIPSDERSNYLVSVTNYDFKWNLRFMHIEKASDVTIKDNWIYIPGEELVGFDNKDELARQIRYKLKEKGLKIHFMESELYEGYTKEGERVVQFLNWMLNDPNIQQDTIVPNRDIHDIENYVVKA